MKQYDLISMYEKKQAEQQQAAVRLVYQEV
jgi:hypothetical protein